MCYRRFHLGIACALVSLTLCFSSFAFSQDRPQPNFGPSLRPLLKMTGLVNAEIEKTETRPVVTLALPGQQNRYKFLVTDTKLLAGPLRTPSDILAEVKPYTTSFYLRGPQDLIAQVGNATPSEPIAITAEYSRHGRLLFVQGIEKVEEPPKETEKK